MLGNLDYFHLDSGEDVVYFLPGFLNNPCGGLVSGILNYFSHAEIIHINGYGAVQFYMQDFVECVHALENNDTGWRYSGECELLLFNVDAGGKICPRDFYAYNLDDILRNGRNLSSFFRETIHVGKDATDRRQAKRRLDEFYADAILPPVGSGVEFGRESGGLGWLSGSFDGSKYYFISYSSKDYSFVSRIRDGIERAGIRCWMAPRDIPHGTNYAHVIELAIQNAERFILMLSEPSVWSVWVEKELLRAIHYFQHSASDRIMAVWIGKAVDLDMTPMGYPMEGIQIIGSMRSASEYPMLLSAEAKNRLAMIDKVEKNAESYEENMVSVSWIRERFTQLLTISYSALEHSKGLEGTSLGETRSKLQDQNEALKDVLRRMDRMISIRQDSFMPAFLEAEELSRDIQQTISVLLTAMKSRR